MKYLLLAVVLGLLMAAEGDCGETRTDDAGVDAGRDAGWFPTDPDWDPSLPDGGYPGSGKNGDPGTYVLFLVRVDRGTANLSPAYESMVNTFTASLGESGIGVRTVVVASLHDGKLLWARGRMDFPPTNLASVLNFHAARSTEPTASCPTSGLVGLGLNINSTQLIYPPELTGGFFPSRNPFLPRPGAFLVVLVDSGERYASLVSTQCQSQGKNPVDYLGGNDLAGWLGYPARLSRRQTRFAAFHTPERTTVEQMRSACLAVSGFPQSAVDLISPSSVDFFPQFEDGMNIYSPRLVTRQDFCVAVGTDQTLFARELGVTWAAQLRAMVGLP
jgi:hypothetical protein